MVEESHAEEHHRGGVGAEVMTEKIKAVSMYRYRGGAAEKRLYGGQGTVTEFYIYFGDEKEPVKMMGHGPTPGQRKTDAIERAKALRNKTMPQSNPTFTERPPRKGWWRLKVHVGPELAQQVKWINKAYRAAKGKMTDYDYGKEHVVFQVQARDETTARAGLRYFLSMANVEIPENKIETGGLTKSEEKDSYYANPDGDNTVAWFALGALAVAGGVIWYATRTDEAKAATPALPPAKKCTSYDAVEKFAKNIGYNVWYVEAQAVSTWQPAKPEYKSDPKARAYSQLDCAFYKWTGSAWVVDDATNTELAAWVQSTTVAGHPISAFIPGVV